ncbi:MAG: hypothetical protein PHH54_06135 [Candidatus Nanoarchaeia archaeon]|nr:hypothetical protein [Candidatus Nanoarchaeia archaeon]MDD5741533.1 hypothetical protein [Candidatus Nanoarchaeia archaeon]
MNEGLLFNSECFYLYATHLYSLRRRSVFLDVIYDKERIMKLIDGSIGIGAIVQFGPGFLKMLDYDKEEINELTDCYKKQREKLCSEAPHSVNEEPQKNNRR